MPENEMTPNPWDWIKRKINDREKRKKQPEPEQPQERLPEELPEMPPEPTEPETPPTKPAGDYGWGNPEPEEDEATVKIPLIENDDNKPKDDK